MDTGEPTTSESQSPTVSPVRAYAFLAVCILGYIGIYLCRKNFSVAIPMLREEFGVSREEIGKIASYSTIAYMIGKLTFGPIVDRLGGRICFLFCLLLVALFGTAGAFAGSLPPLAVFYSLNRFFGAAGWGSMMKMVPEWFSTKNHAFAIGLLSLSFVFGGVCATLLAGWIADLSQNNWRWVMGGPAIVLAAILILCTLVLPRGAGGPAARRGAGGETDLAAGFRWPRLLSLFLSPKFWVLCALSFTLTLLREAFNTWTPDFFMTVGGDDMSNRIAAFLSTPFDGVGALGIVALGFVFGRLGRGARTWLLFGILGCLAAVIYALPALAERGGLAAATIAVGVVGFLAYGPYSLLAGILSLEVRGKDYVATVACIVDAVGYLAGILAGQALGRIIDTHGYTGAFHGLALLSLLSAVLFLLFFGFEQLAERWRARQTAASADQTNSL